MSRYHEDLYRWHIEKRSGPRIKAGVPTDKWKRSVADYVDAAKELHASMKANGFDPLYAIPVDPYGELLDGSHRLACAIALGIEYVPTVKEQRFVWAPPWGRDWFIENGLPMGEVVMLDLDMEQMRK